MYYNDDGGEELSSYEDRKKWFRYHIHNSRINEENAWKQMNEMIRMKIKNNPDGSIKQMIDRIWEENEDIFDYGATPEIIYKHLDYTNEYLMQVRYQKLNNVIEETQENNSDNKK